jgi:DNA ligase-1
MADLADGESTTMQGSGSKPYVLKNIGGVYSCTCPAWCNQSKPIERRTCKHLIKLRGEEAEMARLGDAMTAPPRVASPTDKAVPPVLLAESWDTEANLAGWWMSEKLDGVRAWWDGKQFWSRQGNLFHAPDWFLASLPDVPLDGELWIGRKAFQRTVSIARRQDKSEHWRELRFVVFDAPQHGGVFEARMDFLQGLLRRQKSEFALVHPHEPCRHLDHLREELARVESLGGEGLMLRQPGSLYVAGRSTTLLKVKNFHDAEATVIGHEPGAGRHKGRLGALFVQLENGIRFSVGTGFSDAERENPPALGAVINFRYQELTDAGVPRFPAYVGIRGQSSGSGRLVKTPAAPPPRTAPATRIRVPAGVPAAETAGPAREDASATTPTRRFEYEAADGTRFWEATRQGPEVRLRFGTVGKPERTKTMTFAGEAEARTALEELIAEKIEDGFREQGAAAAARKEERPPVKPAAKAGPTASPATSGQPGRRHFEFVEGTSSKFWEVWVAGNQMMTRYGRIGSQGSTTVKTFADEPAARKAADKLVAEKVGKGYVERGAR